MKITTTVVATATALLLFAGAAFTPPNVSSAPRVPQHEVIEQKRNNLMLVHEIGSEIGHPETLQAILLQETNGGTSTLVGNPTAPVRQRSYGLMQVQIGAARSILSRYPELLEKYFNGKRVTHITDTEMVQFLTTNHEGNVRIAAYHFRLYFNMVGGDWSKAVAAYNVGIGGVKRITKPDSFKYVREIKQKLQTIVQPFNRKHDLVAVEAGE